MRRLLAHQIGKGWLGSHTAAASDILVAATWFQRVRLIMDNALLQAEAAGKKDRHFML